MSKFLKRFTILPIILTCLMLLACSTSAETLYVGGIPDQDTERLARRYEKFADYLSKELNVNVQFKPSIDYSAVVVAFSQGDLDLAFFGGLTGVQARIQDEGAQAIAQRKSDARYLSKFIVKSSLDINDLSDLKQQASDLTLTFGSENSTSGNLMPRFFMLENGIDPDSDFKTLPNYSGSHDLTWKLVQDGAFDVGAVNYKVWNRAVSEGKADPALVREFYTTPEYYDYNWTVRSDIETKFGDGFTEKITQALLDLNPSDHAEILELFNADQFITTNNSNYDAIKDTAEALGIIK